MVLAFYNTLRRTPLPHSQHSAPSQDVWGTGLSRPTLCSQDSAVLTGQLESWAWRPVLAIPKLHVPQEQDWLGLGGKDLLNCPPIPIVPWQVNAQGFGVQGEGTDWSHLNLSIRSLQTCPLRSSVLSLPRRLLLRPSLLVRAACPTTPHTTAAASGAGSAESPSSHRL